MDTKPEVTLDKDEILSRTDTLQEGRLKVFANNYLTATEKQRRSRDFSAYEFTRTSPQTDENRTFFIGKVNFNAVEKEYLDPPTIRKKVLHALQTNTDLVFEKTREGINYIWKIDNFTLEGSIDYNEDFPNIPDAETLKNLSEKTSQDYTDEEKEINASINFNICSKITKQYQQKWMQQLVIDQTGLDALQAQAILTAYSQEPSYLARDASIFLKPYLPNATFSDEHKAIKVISNKNGSPALDVFFEPCSDLDVKIHISFSLAGKETDTDRDLQLEGPIRFEGKDAQLYKELMLGLGNFHPGLVPNQIAERFPQTLYSDHVPIRFSIPIGNNKVPMVSWNIWNKDAPSGFDLTKMNHLERYQRIIDSIIRLIGKGEVPVIMSQETSEEFHGLLVQRLKADNLPWTALHHTGLLDNGLITLFDTKRYELKKTDTSKKLDDRENSVYQQLTLTDKENKKNLLIHNIHKAHRDIPEDTELLITKFLSKADSNTISVVAGDFNTRFAPTDLNKRNIITGAVPIPFSFCENAQGTDFTDAAFYQKERVPIQTNMQTYNPVDWEPVQTKEFQINKLTQNQINEMSRYRIIGVVEKNRDENRHLFKQEALLREKLAAYFGDSTAKAGVFIRYAANAMNERTMALVLSSKLAALVENPDLESYQITADGSHYRGFLPKNKDMNLTKFYDEANQLVNYIIKKELDNINNTNAKLNDMQKAGYFCTLVSTSDGNYRMQISENLIPYFKKVLPDLTMPTDFDFMSKTPIELVIPSYKQPEVFLKNFNDLWNRYLSLIVEICKPEMITHKIAELYLDKDNRTKNQDVLFLLLGGTTFKESTYMDLLKVQNSFFNNESPKLAFIENEIKLYPQLQPLLNPSVPKPSFR